jgi:prepilin-type N-terminal cleavage/methylation domain-containing protein
MRRPRSGFTLVEVLLVLAILAIVTVIAMPTFVHSIRGNRLRTAARTVAMAGKYARSMALLQQREMTLTFDLDKASLTIAVAGRRESEPEPNAGMAGMPVGPSPLESDPTNRAVIQAEAEVITRTLEQVTIAAVGVGEQGTMDVSEGACRVVYRSNGLCTPYRVTIVDTYGGSVTIDVDALGSAVTSGQ